MPNGLAAAICEDIDGDAGMANLGERTEHEMLDMPERERLDVQLEGSQDELTRINPEDLKLVLDAAALEPGLHTVELNLVLPEGMRFRNIERPRVKINITNRKILKKN